VAALEQARVELLLQLLDLKRNRRLRHEQLLRGLREAHLPGNGVKNLQAAVGHLFVVIGDE